MDISKLIEANKVAIRENELRKRQALEQLRNWLKKHPFIKRCRQDDILLLMFLRTRKYSFDDSAKSLENHFLLRMKRPEWFNVEPPVLDQFKSLVRSGFVYLLKDRDSLGQAVFCLNAEKFDTTKYNLDFSFYSTYIPSAIALEDEVTQIIGIVYVLNYSNISMSFFSLHTVTDIVDWVKSAGSLPGRLKKFIIIGLPAFANTLLNVVKMTITEKQRDRLLILDTCEELCQHIDPSILPEKFGGTQSEEKIIEHFIKAVDDNTENLKESNDFEIDETKAAHRNKVDKTVGSFRMLDID